MSDNKYETVQNNILDLQRSNENLYTTSQSTLLFLGKSLKALDKQNKKIEVLQEEDSAIKKNMQQMYEMNMKMFQWNLNLQKQQTETQNQIVKLNNFSYNNYELFARLGTHLSDRIESNRKNIQNIATNEGTTINKVAIVLKDYSQKFLELETATGKAALKNEKSRKALENKVQYDNMPFWKRNKFGFGKKTFDQQVSNETLKDFEDKKKKEAKELQEKIDTLSGLEKQCKIEDVKIEKENVKMLDDLRQINNQIIQRQEEKRENEKRVSYIANNDKRHIALEIYNKKISTRYFNNTSGVIGAIMDTLKKEIEQKEESKNLLKIFDAPLKSVGPLRSVMLYLLKHHTNKDLHTEMDAISCFDTEFKKELDKGMSKEEIFDDIINNQLECIDYLMHIICLYLERPCVQIYNQRVNPLCMDKFANQPAFHLIMGKTHIYSTEYIDDEEKQKLFKSNEYFPKSLYNKIGTTIKDGAVQAFGSISDFVSTKGGSEKSQEMTQSMVHPIDVPFNNHSYEPFNNPSYNEVPFAKNSFSDNNMMNMRMMINSNPGYHRVENVEGRIENV